MFKYNDCSQLLHSVEDTVLPHSLKPPARGIIYAGPEDLPRPQEEIAEDGSLRTSCRLSQCLALSPCHQTVNERVIHTHPNPQHFATSRSSAEKLLSTPSRFRRSRSSAMMQQDVLQCAELRGSHYPISPDWGSYMVRWKSYAS